MHKVLEYIIYEIAGSQIKLSKMLDIPQATVNRDLHLQRKISYERAKKYASISQRKYSVKDILEYKPKGRKHEALARKRRK